MFNTHSRRRIRSFDPALGDFEYASVTRAPSSRRLPAAMIFAVALLLSTAAIAGGALMVDVPLAVAASIGFVLAAYVVATVVLFTDAARKRRGKGGTGARPHPLARLRREIAPLHSTAAASAGAVAALSVGLLGVALVAPGAMGATLAALGVVGLFGLRLLATAAGWAPRRLAWASRMTPRT